MPEVYKTLIVLIYANCSNLDFFFDKIFGRVEGGWWITGCWVRVWGFFVWWRLIFGEVEV